MSNPIRIGIVGTGGMANHHAKTFNTIPGVTLASCLDVVPERAREFAAKHNVARIAASLEELLDQADAVSVVTPDRFHAEPSIAALRAGKHLLCEKPLTVTLAEARRVAVAAQDASRQGVVHMIDFSYRASAAFQKAIQLVAGGALGEVRHVHSYYLQSWLTSDIWGNWSKEALLWRLQTAAGSGGALGDLGCHILDMTTAVAGEVKRARCDMRTFPKLAADGGVVTEWQGRKLDANDTALIELELHNGATGVVQVSRWATGHANSLRLEVHGTTGALLFDLDRDPNQIDLCLDGDRHHLTWKSEKLPQAPNIWQRFIAAIQNRQPDQPDVLRGAQVQAYLDACERSAVSGRWEAVEAWT